MSNVLVSSSVSSSGVVAMYTQKAAHAKNETKSGAINIGNLDGESTLITVSDKGSVATTAVSKSFVAKDGTVSLSQAIDNYVDIAFTRFQLTDGTGTVIADSDGTTEQQAAYKKWVDGALAISAGTYTITATPETQYTGDIALTVSSQEVQGTSLQVSSELTGNDKSEYYNFSLSGTNIKLDLNAGTDTKNIRVVLYNSNGSVVADSDGNAYQKTKYLELTSASGLSASSGDYSIGVTYKDNVDTINPIDYTFKLYSGNTYAAVYTSNVKAVAYDGTAVGSVEATADAGLYETTAYNKIVTSAEKAINIGWLQEDKSMLDVYSQLTNADNTNYYIFTLQQGDNLKFGFNPKTTKDTSPFRVQLMDSTGSRVIADNYGTAAQREMYKKLTASTGIETKEGSYIVKITYAEGVERTDKPYEFGIYSGTTYAAQYKTTASAQTYANAILSGELGSSTAASAGIAAYLTAKMNGEDMASDLANALRAKY